MDVTGLVAQGDEVTSLNQDAESWSRLEPGICDMILGKLPHLERFRLRGVCKEWNRSALQSMEHKPYLVSIVRREYNIEREYIGLFEYDAVTKSLDIERLVPIRLGSPYRAVDGLIFCERPDDEKEWCVYIIHSGTKHVVPPAPGSGVYTSVMMVDTSEKPYTFKLVVSYNSDHEKTQIYDSASRSWSLHPKSNQHSENSSDVLLPRNDGLFLTLCHKGSMYMSSDYLVFVYSMDEDQWTRLSGHPFVRSSGRPYLGAWDDRIFAVVHVLLDVDGVADGSVVVWELVDETQQEWVEYARCPQAQFEQLFVHAPLYGKSDFVSVFCEEYVLMQHWYGWRSHALLLLNLKSREWECSYQVEEETEEYYHEFGL